MSSYLGQDFKKLGFGLMRLPVLENEDIDIEQLKKMVDHFISSGFTYFDTAYVYHGGKSEKAIKTALVKDIPGTATTGHQAGFLAVQQRGRYAEDVDKQLERTASTI
jgi:predicted aldo/keto reductase-like oxidoreductase